MQLLIIASLNLVWSPAPQDKNQKCPRIWLSLHRCGNKNFEFLADLN